MSPLHSEPSPKNLYQIDHAQLLQESFQRVTGTPLLEKQYSPEDAAKALFEAPFALLSHDTQPDPIFTYGNRTAQRLFEITWDELLQLPSRFSAELPNRDERARLLKMVTAQGYINHYEGVRISKTGRRFLIKGAVVWNLIDHQGVNRGQAASFDTWSHLD
ncbi:MAG: MEKHLA domain-containing protein [Verrucomicrobiota bacterium]